MAGIGLESGKLSHWIISRPVSAPQFEVQIISVYRRERERDHLFSQGEEEEEDEGKLSPNCWAANLMRRFCRACGQKRTIGRCSSRASSGLCGTRLCWQARNTINIILVTRKRGWRVFLLPKKIDWDDSFRHEGAFHLVELLGEPSLIASPKTPQTERKTNWKRKVT